MNMTPSERLSGEWAPTAGCRSFCTQGNAPAVARFQGIGPEEVLRERCGENGIVMAVGQTLLVTGYVGRERLVEQMAGWSSGFIPNACRVAFSCDRRRGSPFSPVETSSAAKTGQCNNVDPATLTVRDDSECALYLGRLTRADCDTVVPDSQIRGVASNERCFVSNPPV
jgi:hypothetical protein